MMNRILSACACTALLVLSGCAAAPSSTVRVDKADTDFGKCRTFDWHHASSDAASLTEQRVRATALKQLQEKGYALATDKPDCRITYVMSSQERQKQKPSIGVGVGGGSGGIGGGIGVGLPINRNKEQIGTFTLDVVDVAQNAQIWSGTVDVGLHAQEISDEEADRAVGLILAKFPDHRAAK